MAPAREVQHEALRGAVAVAVREGELRLLEKLQRMTRSIGVVHHEHVLLLGLGLIAHHA